MKLARGAVAFTGALPWFRMLASGELPAKVKLAIDQVYVVLCHHIPDRTLVFRGEAMCVCSRCAGLYAGMLVAALVSWKGNPRFALHAGLALMLLDIVTQDAGLHAPCHLVRLATGAWVGTAATGWMLREIDSQAPRGRGQRGEWCNGSVRCGWRLQRFSARLSRADRSASRKATVAKPA